MVTRLQKVMLKPRELLRRLVLEQPGCLRRRLGFR
jgi:hypothetical protein